MISDCYPNRFIDITYLVTYMYCFKYFYYEVFVYNKCLYFYVYNCIIVCPIGVNEVYLCNKIYIFKKISFNFETCYEFNIFL